MTDAPLVLVGNAKAGTITTLRFDGERLTHLADSTVGAGCAAFAVDAARDRVYSATKEPEASIVTLVLDRATGALTEVGRLAIPETVAYLDLAQDGTVLLGGSYHGGWGTSWRVDEEGALHATDTTVRHANVHCSVADPSGTSAYFVALGDDLVAQNRLDADGTLTPLDPPTVSLPEGCGPRHLTFSADGSSAYLVTEFSGEVFRFDRDAEGALELAESVDVYAPDRGLKHSRYGAEPKAEHLIWGADVHVVQDGRRLVASERTESTLATIALDADGQLGDVEAFAETEQQPRGFNVMPDGRHLVVAGEASGGVALVRVEDDGSMTQLDRLDTGAGPNWVRVA